MSDDKRFKRTNYMFFPLSVVEYYRSKSIVSVPCKMRQGDHTPTNSNDNMHSTMHNIRGSAAYSHRVCSLLIAMIRCLRAPTWFLTFSCNDLNRIDMLISLLIADGRDPNKFDLESISFSNRRSLVERYPGVVSRQFTIRVNALICFLRSNPNVLGGPVGDFWYRIEFQNRGSPHLHMLV